VRLPIRSRTRFTRSRDSPTRIQEELGPETDRSEPARQLLKALHSLGELADDVLAISGSPRPAGEVVLVGDILSSAVVLARAPESRVRVEASLQGLLVRDTAAAGALRSSISSTTRVA